MVNFNFSLQPHLPLGISQKLADPEFPIPIAFAYGENDWTRVVDQDYAKVCVEANKFEDSKFFEVPNSDHNMHMDNPQALSHIIINFCLDKNLPVLNLTDQKEQMV